MTNTQARRVLAAGGVAAALALLSAAPAGAADWPDPKVSTVDGKTVMTFLAHTESETFTPKGGKPGSGEINEVPKPGDAFGFEDVNSQDGTEIGTNSGTCVIVAATETSGSGNCTVKVTFANGTLTVDGKTDFSEDDAPFTLPIAGGTGAYAGAQGMAKVTNINDTDTTITLTYTTSGSQVSATPVGGAAAGGGFAGGATDTSMLALGALGFAGGAILLTMGRNLARRPH